MIKDSIINKNHLPKSMFMFLALTFPFSSLHNVPFWVSEIENKNYLSLIYRCLLPFIIHARTVLCLYIVVQSKNMKVKYMGNEIIQYKDDDCAAQSLLSNKMCTYVHIHVCIALYTYIVVFLYNKKWIIYPKAVGCVVHVPNMFKSSPYTNARNKRIYYKGSSISGPK